MSEVTPAEWRKHCFVSGLIILGLPAILSPLPLGAETMTAEQHVATANADGVAEGVSPTKAATAYSIRVIKQGPDRLKLKGVVASREDHRALLGLVKASCPSADVSDRVKIADGQKSDMKLGGVSFALKALSYLQTGTASIDADGILLSGEPDSGASYGEMKTLIASERPTGLIVRDDIAVPRTFSWSAEIGEGKIKLNGAVPDGLDKRELEAVVQRLFSGLEIVNNTYVAEGAPQSWLDAAVHSLKVLRLLDTGVVVVEDHSIQVDGHASDDTTLRKIDALADQYPAGFALQSTVSIPTVQASVLGLQLPAAATAYRRAFESTEEKADIDLQGGATK